MREFLIIFKMPRKRKNIVYFHHQPTRDSTAVPWYRRLRNAIDGTSTQEELVILLNQSPIQALKYKDNGIFLLHHACQIIGYEKVALRMWEKYPDAAIKQKKWTGYRNPLHVACSEGRIDIVRLLMVGAPHLINEQCSNGCTPLFSACKMDQVEVIKFLLTNSTNINVNHCDKYNKNAAQICCYNRHDQALMILLNHPNMCLHTYLTTLESFFFAISTNYISDLTLVYDILNFLIKKIPSVVDGNGRKFNLIHAHINGNWYYFYGFDYLIENGYVSLLNQNDIKGDTPLHLAATNCSSIDIKRIKIVLEQQCYCHNVRNDKGRTPLHSICRKGYYEFVHQLLENPNTDSDMMDYGGENALHHALQGYMKTPRFAYSYIQTIHVLLKKNPFLVIKKNNNGESPYDYAMKLKTITHGRQMIQLNGKSRRYNSMELNSGFSSNLVEQLNVYHNEARFSMFVYFMESDINHS